MTVTFYDHPDYIDVSEELKTWHDLYSGRRKYVTDSKYLFPHQLESLERDANSAKLWASRQTRTRYYNIPEMVVSIWSSIFFDDELILDPATDALLKERIDSIDGRGTSFNKFARDAVLLDYLIYGRVFILADNYSFENLTVGQRTERKIYPYLTRLDPLGVRDWAIEQDDSARVGRLNYLRYTYKQVRQRESSTQEPKYDLVSDLYERKDGKYILSRYKIEDQAASVSVGDKLSGWKLEAEAITNLEEIPIAYYFGDSWIKDVCEETLRHYNLRSNRDNQLYYRGHQQVFTVGVDLADSNQRAALTEYTVVGLPTGANAFAIAPTDTQPMDRAIAEAREEAIRVGLNQLRTLPTDSGVGQSAEALNKERENTRKLISSSLFDIQNILNTIVTNYGLLRGVDITPDVKLSSDEFEVAVDNKLNVIMALREDMARSKTLRDETAMLLAESLIKDPEKLKVIRNELTATPAQQRSSILGLIGNA